MKATAKSFFGTNLEQEVLDEIVILPVAIRNTGTGTIRLPVNMEWKDFEYIEIALGIATNVQVYDMSTISGAFLKSNPSAWSVRLQLNDGTSYGLVVSASGANTASWSSFGASNYPRYMIGYKRRISRVGIDELMSAMSLPNLIANADLTDNPINQRNFNGNWSALAVGAYGYDQWMKVSDTHMGYVVEDGKYRPNTKHTLTINDVVVKEVTSPASGHWSVAVPFTTSGKFDLYAGQFKRPWHPVQDGLERCHRYFEKGRLSTVCDGAVAYASACTKIVSKRENAVARVYDILGNQNSCSFDSTHGVPATVTIEVKNSVVCRVSNRVGATNVFVHFNWQVEGVITLAEVGGQITTV
ncbi:hypothetical protein [Vibrio cholerae]|uniref:hypothetical protein n=1 Tax=Vibrio cholerae TaxID=666 RepID=UPI0011DA3AC4|nr:hypothetical protein [Vibrio cholerae]TXY22945.1 hypothetical protein FXE90_09990 [Vibrio cholerae]GHX75382.1 hypothetical protein VCSRO110_0659 [Vibrio cholerae]